MQGDVTGLSGAVEVLLCGDTKNVQGPQPGLALNVACPLVGEQLPGQAAFDSFQKLFQVFDFIEVHEGSILFAFY